MLSISELNKIVFLDIETVPLHSSFEELTNTQKKHWENKAKFDPLYKSGEVSLAESYQRAGIYAEFGKVVCISVGYFFTEKKRKVLRIKSLYNEDEKVLLNNLLTLLSTLALDTVFCAHNGKEFDYPYLCRRLLVNGFEIPKLLDLRGKKSWDVKHLDTLELWKFGDYKHYVSLDLLASIFEIESSKNEMDGSMVYAVFYKEKNLKKIAKYCEMDVWVLANVFLKLHAMEAVSMESTEFV